LACIIVLCYQSAHAKSHPIIQLSDNVSVVNIGSKISIINDQHNDLNAHEIAQIVNDTATSKDIHSNNDKNVTLNKGTDANWLYFTLDNQSHFNDHWLLDVGTVKNGLSGHLKRIYIYDLTAKNFIFDSNQNAQLHENFTHGRFIPLYISQKETKKFAIYAEASTIHDFTFIPKLINPHKIPLYLSNENWSLETFIVEGFYILTLAAIILLLAGFRVTKTSNLIPIALFYILSFIWTIASTNHLSIMSFGILEIGSKIFPFLGLVIILILAHQLGVDCKNNTPRNTLIFRILIVLLGIASTLHFIDFTFAIPPEIIAIAIMIISSIFIAVYMITSAEESRSFHIPHNLLTIWSIITCAGILLPYAYKTGLIASKYIIMANFNIIAFYITLPIIVTYINALTKNYNLNIVKGAVRRIQERHTLENKKNKKEASDHARLLRVIEREREVMEELRGRENLRAEEMRQAKIVADEANQAKSAFLAVVSHEIRTPMTGVMGIIRLLEDTDLSPEQRDHLMTVRASGDTMLSLLNDILDFSKIEGGAMDIEWITFDMQRILNDVALLMRGHAEQKNIEIKISIDSSIPRFICGDPTRLRQIVLNLVSNALKFTDKGSVEIRAQAISEDDIRFSIVDTGIGISSKALNNLFKPFSQADTSIARQYGGTGLGLSICKKLVEAMGGDIAVKSQENVGTTFEFTLPLLKNIPDDANNNAQNDYNLTIETTSLPPMTFLVIDDNDVNQKVLSSFMEKGGHHVTCASSGCEAMEIVKEKSDFDGIFTDIEMPDINGCDLLEHFLANDETQNIPVIAVTGNVSEDDFKSSCKTN